MSTRRKKGQTIHKEGREIIRNIIEKCDQEAREGKLQHLLQQGNLRAADYAGVSLRSITTIRKEGLSAGVSPLQSPGKKRPKSEEHKFHCDDFDRRVIRDIIRDFYLVQKEVPTAPKLLTAIQRIINFPWKVHTLRRLLHAMGFKWKRCGSNRKILIERLNIVNWRGRYLQSIRTFRNQNRNIVYIDESWVDNNITFGKCWQNDKISGITTNTSSSNRLILVHAGSKSGFITGAQLIFKAGLSKGDYHGQMNAINFERWLTNKLLPNLPKESVIIIDNAPYHSVQENKPPTKYAVKRDMMEWLQKNNVPFSESMKKFELFDLIHRFKKPEKVYRFDEMLRLHGHTVLRLPPYMCELNAIELAWAKIKRVVREHNVTGNLSLTKLQEVTSNAIASVTPADWEQFEQHVIKVENEFWEKDGLLEDIMDNIVINIGGVDSSDEDDDDRLSGSSSDSDKEEEEANM